MTELKDGVREFVYAGNAIITLESENTKNHFTYKIKQSKDKDNLYFINLLRGQDNENDYTYIGCVYSDNDYFNPSNRYKEIPKDVWPPSLRAISYFFRKLDNLPPKLHVYHQGRCARCGRLLTTPESIKRGFGPECCKL